MAYSPVYQMSIISGLLEQQLDADHDLLILGGRVDWAGIEERLMPYYSLLGRKAKPVRLMVGLHILKHRYDCSDEEVVQGLHENVYWMAFCGLEGELGSRPWRKRLEASTMAKFRRRVGAEGMAVVEAVINGQLVQSKQINPKRQLVGTMVQEKNVAYPRDTHLLARGRKWIVKTVEKLKTVGVRIPLYAFADQAKRVIVYLNKLGKDRAEQVKAKTRELVDIVRKVVDQVPDTVSQVVENLSERMKNRIQQLQGQLQRQKQLIQRVIAQTEARLQGIQLPHKVLSLHEPQVVAIAKGKHKKPYEYGSKVSLSMDTNGYIVGHQEYADARSDLETLDPAVQQWQEVCGRPADELGGDRGYHTPTPSEVVSRIRKVAVPTKGNTPHPDSKRPYFQRLQRKRAGMEAVIGHLKSDHRMNRCRYKGFEGDKINVTLAVMAWNTKKWVKKIKEQRNKVG